MELYQAEFRVADTLWKKASVKIVPYFALKLLVSNKLHPAYQSYAVTAQRITHACLVVVLEMSCFAVEFRPL